MTAGGGGIAGALLRQIRDDWERFWFSKGSTLSLGLFRIVFAYCLYDEVNTTFAKSKFAIEGGFHLPYVSFIGPTSFEIYRWIHLAQYPLIVLLGLGLFMRFSCAALVGLQGYVFLADQLNFRNHPYFFIMLVFLLMLSPADDALSVKSLVRAFRERAAGWGRILGSQRSLMIQRLIQVQVCLVYYFAGVQKINEGFLGGHVLSHYLSKTAARGDFADMLRWFSSEESFPKVQAWFENPDNLVGMAWVSLVLELVLPFVLWFRWTRPGGMIVGVFFHLGIAFTMNIHVFSYAMIGSYLLFLEPDTLPRLVRRVLPAAPPRPAEALAGRPDRSEGR